MSAGLRLLIFDRDYPDGVNLYSDVFVHVRAKEYAKRAEVVVAAAPSDRPSWWYEGIPVRTFPSVAGLGDFVASFRPDVVVAHFVEEPVIRAALLGSAAPFVAWVHGYEGMGWYRRLFDVQGPIALARYVRNNVRQLLALRKLIGWSNRSGRGAFVFPSRWLRRVTQLDTATRIRRAFVVPNPIDPSLFGYSPKSPAMRRRVLLIRSYESRKYATDVATDAICRFSRSPSFHSFHFSLYGRGRFFSQDVSRLASFDNVEIHDSFIAHRDLPAVHADHGVLLCPTRQDSQGVTMCEAMCSGLVPVTTRNTGVPEFVADGVNGFLTTSATAIAERLADIDREPERFSRMSEAAAVAIREKCDLTMIVGREFEIIEARARTSEPGS